MTAGRFQMTITREKIMIFKISLFHLKVDDLTVLLMYNTKYFGQKCALHRTPKKQPFLQFAVGL